MLDTLSPTVGGRKLSLPPPTQCPSCRLRRRMAWRNERFFFRRSCTLCSRPIVSIYPEDTPFPVYCSRCFWSDEWDGLAHGREFDFSKPLFEQLTALQRDVPRIALLSKNSENSDFANHTLGSRNCYMCVGAFGSEDVLFSRKVSGSRRVMDSSFVLGGSDAVYECFWVQNVQHCSHLINCFSMIDSHFCIDCRNCDHCFRCWNLRNKRWCFENEQLSQDEYLRRTADWMYKRSVLQEHQQRFETIRQHVANYRCLDHQNCEDCRGDQLVSAKNLYECYDTSHAENLRYCAECEPTADLVPSKTCMDVWGFGSGELLYEVQAQVVAYQNVVSNFSYNVKSSLYTDNCHNSTDCTACISVRGMQYCVLNRQYSRAEYESLVPRIVEHLTATGEWGEFFPISLSPYPYNQTVAGEYFPLSEASLQRLGGRRVEYEPTRHRPTVADLPDDLREIPEAFEGAVMECRGCHSSYRLTRAELDFYRAFPLPVPERCANCRHVSRQKLRRSWSLCSRRCASCSGEVESSFAPSRPEKILCERCYLAAVY